MQLHPYPSDHFGSREAVEAVPHQCRSVFLANLWLLIWEQRHAGPLVLGLIAPGWIADGVGWTAMAQKQEETSGEAAMRLPLSLKACAVASVKAAAT